MLKQKRKSMEKKLARKVSYRPFSHSTSVRTNNSTIARLGWTFSYIYCIFVHPNLDSVLLFVGMQERSIVLGPPALCGNVNKMAVSSLSVWNRVHLTIFTPTTRTSSSALLVYSLKGAL